ncbi:MAG: shikimate kinase [Fusobacterium gastrosuis]|uniref:shikimate kinase n=1 Tax=Fusobacterium TaxID=848 RepID=UPI001F4FFE19|nr:MULTISPECIES: shikimate kinase [Fusobacterium]MDD7392212.1 shikimate kinase [Fusobacteriaceae bacterium]MCI5724270.1 shikimate kinase [Fusobacterium sp.]MCI7223632.1 shikimate kinase [Fusobacterium sp.]MDD7411458.1 shikimate kinase [Fusobacteriaceae bacterium]MDY4011330.1 shikimate kinase [Fusobacterium gastrosuis]
MKDNIALIGFMGSGKTTVGKALAKLMEMKFVDVDKVIAAREKKSINEIFEEKGQIYFRDLEREIIAQESLKNNCVISTGGGSILDNENIKRLRETSFVVYLDCTIECLYQRLKNSTTRPILNVAEDKKKIIEDLYEKRRFLYEISADYTVKIDEKTNVFDTVNTIKDAYITS